MARYAVRSEAVRFRAGQELAAGCLYLPKLKDRQPGVLFVQAEAGLDGQALGMAERLAHVGYVTLAVDAYAGALEQPSLRAESAARANALLCAALAWLRGRPQVKAAIAGAFGIGAGGALALRLAQGDHPVQAAVSIDGDDATVAALAVAARVPLLVALAGPPIANERDVQAHSDGPDGVRLRAGLPHEFVRYPSAGRGFFDERGPAFCPEDAEDAWSRANKFFYKHLGEPG